MELSGLAWMAFVLALWQGAALKDDSPAYQREGDRVEHEFRSYRDQFDQFAASLRGLITQDRPTFLPQLQEAPPAPVVSGYQVLPRIVVAPSVDTNKPVTTFSYSWAITESYVEGEKAKLEQAAGDLDRIKSAADAPPAMVAKLVRDYRELATNQRTIDQYIQYNRFWQGSIAFDRNRFDQLTRVYELLKSGEPDTARAIREVLGKPSVPAFVRIKESTPERVVIQVPVYTDIDDEEFLARAKTAIEEMWQASDGSVAYSLEIEFRRRLAADLYPADAVPRRGARLDIKAHAARFPADGAVLTTGATSTHGFVGRYVALASGDVSTQTLAHEFGHVLGFNDGYVRGYRDLGEQGFEILELTAFFDDIMSAPRQGRVQPEHFKLILDALKR